MELLELMHISEDAIVRVKQGTPPMVSVIDIIKVMTGKNNNHSAEVFRRISINFPDVTDLCVNFQFPGQGQRPTPVADLDTILMILQHLPGPSAQQYREKTAEVLRRYLTGDRSMHEDIEANAQASNPLSGFRCMNQSIQGESMPPPLSIHNPYFAEYQKKVYEANLQLTMRNIYDLADYTSGLEKKLADVKAKNNLKLEKMRMEAEEQKIKSAKKLSMLRDKLEHRKTTTEICAVELRRTKIRREQQANNQQDKLAKAEFNNSLQRLINEKHDLLGHRKTSRAGQKRSYSNI